MTLDIHALDEMDPAGAWADKELERNQSALVQAFRQSPEGCERLKADPMMDFWTAPWFTSGSAIWVLLYHG